MIMFGFNVSKKAKIEPHVFSNKVTLLQFVDVADKFGRLSKSAEFVAFDIQKSNSAFGSGDFEVSSLLAVGALNKLQTTYMSPTSSMNIADSFENLNLESNVQ